MSTQTMRLVAFLMTGPTSHHHGMWRHPATENLFLSPQGYEHVARVLENGCFDAIFFADILALPDFYKQSYETIVKYGGQLGLLDPIPILSMMSRVTTHLGLAATISTSFMKPYHLARTLGTLDILSNGRVAWNVVTSSNKTQARNFGVEDFPDRETRYEMADEVLEACFQLWDSWEDNALVLDKEAGIFADPSKIKRVNYDGRWIKTRGPLTVPRSPQGRPVIMQAGSSARGRKFAAKWGEVIFTLQHSKSEMQKFYADLKGLVENEGRSPDDCRILVDIDPIVGETRSIAQERQAYVNELVHPEVGLALMSSHIGTDLSTFPLDKPLSEFENKEGSRGSLDVIIQGTKGEGLTLGEVAKRFATSELCPQIVGTPKDIADQMEDLFKSKACDGFILTPAVLPGSYEDFARMVVPELQRRGLFRTSYKGKTLRENLALG